MQGNASRVFVNKYNLTMRFIASCRRSGKQDTEKKGTERISFQKENEDSA